MLVVIFFVLILLNPFWSEQERVYLLLKRLVKNFLTFKKKSNIPSQPDVEDASVDSMKDKPISNGES